MSLLKFSNFDSEYVGIWSVMDAILLAIIIWDNNKVIVHQFWLLFLIVIIIFLGRVCLQLSKSNKYHSVFAFPSKVLDIIQLSED